MKTVIDNLSNNGSILIAGVQNLMNEQPIAWIFIQDQTLVKLLLRMFARSPEILEILINYLEHMEHTSGVHIKYPYS